MQLMATRGKTVQTLVSDGTLARLLAMLFLFFVVLGSAAIAGYQIVENQPMNPYVLALVSAGISTALTMFGVHLGKTALIPPEKG